MNNLNPIWLSYLPANIAADILAHPDENPVGREQRFEAVALFADIAGFTPLTEAFARQGGSDIEELTLLLNDYFNTMVSLVQSYGGILGKFGGDALTAFFPCLVEERQVTIHRAVQCAMVMQM